MSYSSDPGRDDKPHYHGHRDRLRKRFREGGATALADYEMLELILLPVPPPSRHQADRQGAA